MRSLGLFFTLCLTYALNATPQNHHVTHGNVSFSQTGKNLYISTGDKAIIHWKDFSINKGELVQFLQPGKHSTVLNRVTGGNPSKILGTLKGNGAVFLINKHGVIIGEGGLVETGSFLASTLDLLDSDFLKGADLRFKGETRAGITNLGTINAWDGTVTLLGFTVDNAGLVDAKTTVVGAGAAILLKPDGEGIYIEPSIGDEGDVGISHTGTIRSLETHLKADGNLYALAIKDDGIIDAGSFINRSGRVYLVGDGGTTEVGGFINAPKGNVQILGTRVGLINEGFIDVSGEGQGGTIRLGDPESTDALFVGPNTKLLADGIGHGNGGEIITWGKGANRFYGNFRAAGGEFSGDGGFVEVSSKGSFEFLGSGDLIAPNGKVGTLYLDPTDITLSVGDVNVVPGSPNYTVSPTATANVDVAGLAALLSGTGNVTISTSTAGPNPGIMNISTAFNWTSTNTLTLISDSVMTFTANVLSTGGGSLVLTSGGGINVRSTLSMSNAGTVTVNSAGPVIVGGALATGISAINTDAGDINITTSSGNIEVLGPNVANAHSQIGSTSSGNVTLNSAGDVRVIGGGADDAFGQIGYHGGPTTGNINVTAFQNLFVQGGQDTTTARAFAQIGPGAVQTAAGAYSGNITLNINGTSAIVEGGIGTDNYAAVGYGMGTTNAVVIGPSVLTFLAPSADLILRGGSTTALRNQAVIGYFSNGGGQMNGNVTGDLRISCNTFDLDNSNCGTNSYVALGFATQSSGGTATPYTINSNTIEVVANGTGINQMGRASAVGDQAYVCLGAHVNTSAGLAGQVQIQNLRVQTGGDLLMTGSNALPVTAFIPVTLGVLGGAGSTGVLEVQNLFINCLGLLSMQSGIQHNTNNHSRVEIFNGQSSSSSTLQMTINAQNLNVESSQSLLPAVGAPVDIDSRGFLTINVTQDMTMIGQTATSTATAINDLDVTVGRNFNASGPSTTALANSGGAYTLDVGNDIILGDSAFMIQAFNGTSQPYTMTAGRDIISTNTSTSFVIIQQGGAGFTNDMEIFAGRNIRLPLNTFVRKFGPGNLNIIVDNNFPTFPGIGPGGFTLGATSSVDNFGNFISGGPVRIFTARRSQNFITGFINGTLFTPGAAFVDTDLERWCAYYFNSFVGPNFTIFYKECDELLGELFRSSSAPIVTVEALRNLHPYDEYLGWPLFFDFEYREMERSPIPHLLRTNKRFTHNPKEKEVKAFNFSEYKNL